MPFRDGTGPEGKGPTGRKLGPCGNGEAARGRGRGKGLGRGRGMGRGNRRGRGGF